MSVDPATIAIAIKASGLLAPDLTGAERRALVMKLATTLGVSDETIYRWQRKVLAGQAFRKPRADRGFSRALALAPELQAAAASLLAQPATAHLPLPDLQRLLADRFPTAAGVSVAILRRLRQAIADQLATFGKAVAEVVVAAPNEQWQIDCSLSDFFVVVDPAQPPRRVQLTVCEDACTRSLMYARYSTRAAYSDIAQVLYQSLLPQSDRWPQAGLPQAVLCDWGKVFLSSHLELALASLGIRRDLAHPYYPQDKGKVERVIGTLHHCFEPGAPAYCGHNNKDGPLVLDPAKDFRRDRDGWVCKRDDRPLLTLDQANAALWDWIVGVYHERTHGTLGETPNQAWLRHRPLLLIYSDEFLEETFLERATRRVNRAAVRCHGLSYEHPALANCEGLLVEVRYDAGDLRAVNVYHQGHRLCRAACASVILQSEPLSHETLTALKRQNAHVAAQKRALLKQLRGADVAGPEMLDLNQAAAATAPALALAPPTRLPDPLLPGLTPEDEAELSGYTVAGLPLLPTRRVAAT